MLRIGKAISSVVAIAVFGACGLNGFAFRTPSHSMAPAIEENDLILTNPMAYASEAPQRFDIVVYDAPDDLKQKTGQSGKDVIYFKRVAGLPGEKLELKDNELYINGQHVNQTFEVTKSDTDPKRNYGPITIPDGEYFLLGDSRPNSNDSRYYSHPTIKKDQIHSKVIEVKKGYYDKK